MLFTKRGTKTRVPKFYPMRAIVPFRFGVGECNCGLGAAKRGRRFLKEPGHASQPVQALLLAFSSLTPVGRTGCVDSKSTYLRHILWHQRCVLLPGGTAARCVIPIGMYVLHKDATDRSAIADGKFRHIRMAGIAGAPEPRIFGAALRCLTTSRASKRRGSKAADDRSLREIRPPRGSTI